jgi:hypothetical protein
MTVGKENKNGSPAQATPIGPSASSDGVPAELFELHKKFLSDIWATWGQHRDDAHQNLEPPNQQEKFTRVSIVSLTQAAAVCAVDVAMDEASFLATCKANYQQAVKAAPRWA